MEKEEIVKQLSYMVSPEFTVLSIDAVNHKPHPYTIGPGLVTWVAKHRSGRLDEEAVRAAEKDGVRCAAGKCHLPYDQHTYDKAAFLQLTGNVTKEQVNDKLVAAIRWLETEGVDGIAFVETPQNHRIT